MLNGGYDALLHIDADMIVPADTVDRLMAIEADVAYGLYVSRRDPSRWLCFIDRAMSMPLSAVPTLNREFTDIHIGSFGAGMGCTLIRRHVLEEIAFRTDGTVASDWCFAVDCANYGFIQRHDLGCICGHIDGDKAHYPDITQPNLYRTERL